MATINLPQLVFVALAAVMAFLLLRPLIFGGRRIKVDEASQRIADGRAVLIDVREPGEWQRGVAGPAHLLPLSDLQGQRRQWSTFLAGHKDKELILYCASGLRSATAVLSLRKAGYRAVNLGGIRRWTTAGLPLRKP